MSERENFHPGDQCIIRLNRSCALWNTNIIDYIFHYIIRNVIVMMTSQIGSNITLFILITRNFIDNFD
jgi:hypothetical protein